MTLRTRTLLASLGALSLMTVMTAGTMAADAAGQGELVGTDWTLVSITSEGAGSPVPEGVSATLLLEDGQASGSAGCNTFSGSYTVDGSALAFGPLGSTKMYCEGPAGDVETAYLQALADVASWTLAEDGSLHLLDAEQQELLAFTPGGSGTEGTSAIEGASAIEGVTWLLREQAVDGALGSVPEGVVVSLLMDDGDAAGTGGCNKYSATYSIDGSSIAFVPGMTTLMACEDPAGTVEGAYFANLGAVASFSSDGATLTLADGEGNVVLVYAAAPEASIVGSWVVQGVNNGRGGVVSSLTTSVITAQFSAEGELTGFDGCNDYSAPYELDGDAITIGLISSTLKVCADDEMATQAQEYYAALAKATTWSIAAGGPLELRDAVGGLKVSYLPALGS